MNATRRSFLKTAAGSAALAALGFPAVLRGATGRVVVVGGGFGGATAARYIKVLDTAIEVTLVERDPRFITCPFSNTVLGGLRTLESLTHGYEGLKRQHGINVVQDEVTAVDVAGHTVTLKGGSRLRYDKLVLSPGIELLYDRVPGYSLAATERMPHAWKAGPQTLLLRRQLEAMPDGGTVILAPPDNPFRCPPGPYERASMIAWYLKNHKPKSKILILDAKNAFSKQGLFQAAWDALYPGMITWIPARDGGKVESVDPASLTVTAGFGKEKGAVVNIVPPQRAGEIVHAAGLTDEKGWCPVNPNTFASTKAADVYVVGDSSIAGAMPKSASAANTQAKVAAAAVVAALAGRQPPPALFSNTCYSLVQPDYGISVTDVYVVGEKGIAPVAGAGGVSRAQADPSERRLEATYAEAWYRGIVLDSLGV